MCAASAVALACAGSLATAADGLPSPEKQENYQKKLFALLDGNDDGKVTEKEFAVAVLWDDFQRFDADDDGKVSKAEFMRMAEDKSIYDELDPDGKGHITFKDCFGSKTVVEDLHKKWLELLKETGNEATKKSLKLSDLPDLTP